MPFFKTVSYPLGVFGFIALTYFVIVGASNAVNLTDGLDGLAIMPVVLVGSALGIFAYVTGNAVFSRYLLIPHIPGAGELLIFCAAMAGAGLAFLWFNAYPAQVFMGDVGALALGGALGTIAVITRQEIVLGIMGGVFVLEALSVMIQVSWFWHTKKKLRRRPAHLPDGAAAPPLREVGVEGDAGRRALLDHHHAAVPDRAGELEAALMKHLNDIDVLVLGLGESGLAMALLVRATCARARVGFARCRAGRCRAGRDIAGRAAPARRALRRGLRRREARPQEPGLAPADARIAGLLARAADSGVRCRASSTVRARAGRPEGKSAATRRSCSPSSPAPTARPPPPR